MQKIEKEKFVMFGMQGLIVECNDLRPGNQATWFNGYLGVSRDHPWWRKGINEIEAEVHGGVTYTSHRNPVHGSEKNDVWWVGFTTSHESDLAQYGGEPKIFGFVKEQLTHLADQAQAVKGEPNVDSGNDVQ